MGLGLAAYYNGSLDENRSKIKYSDITGYSYEVVRIDGKASCSDYDGNPLQPASAVRVYVQMHIQTADLFTVTYKVATPTGLLTHGVLHRTGDPAIALPGYNFEADDQTLITVDGATYQAKQHMSENGVTYYFDGWYEDGRYRQRAGASYDGTSRPRSTRATSPRRHPKRRSTPMAGSLATALLPRRSRPMRAARTGSPRRRAALATSSSGGPIRAREASSRLALAW